MSTYIHELPNWCNFTYNHESISPLLVEVSFNQGRLYQLTESNTFQQDKITLDNLVNNIVRSYEIEGETISADALRSSLAIKLNLDNEKQFPVSHKSEGLAKVMTDIVLNSREPLSLERLKFWHKSMFTGDSILNDFSGGEFRSGEVRVMSGAIGKEVIHYEAPAPARLNQEMENFVKWFNETSLSINPLVRAAIAHYYFVAIHPFPDGNGRITRFITDLALAQSEPESIRFYSLSDTIAKSRKSYYDILDKTSTGSSDITSWIIWFLSAVNEALLNTLNSIENKIAATEFWLRKGHLLTTNSQKKVIKRLLDGDFPLGISNKQYSTVAKLTQINSDIEIKTLVNLGVLVVRGKRLILNLQIK